MLNMWDVGGQPSLRSFWRNYFDKTDGLIWVLDSADTARLDDGVKELSTLLSERTLTLYPARWISLFLCSYHNIVIWCRTSLLVLANKQDVSGAKSVDEIAAALHSLTLSRHVNFHLLSCSAVKGAGVDDGLHWLVKDIASRLYAVDTRESQPAGSAESQVNEKEQ